MKDRTIFILLLAIAFEILTIQDLRRATISWCAFCKRACVVAGSHRYLVGANGHSPLQMVYIFIFCVSPVVFKVENRHRFGKIAPQNLEKDEGRSPPDSNKSDYFLTSS
ncbi:hypothetical protein [Dapis sp. BLCC M172]|uniref:hypothetical protein n=1 Tax=Dapis sp. BLCC M172 TaxID=2975281 RepID=UPI003CF3099A